MDERYHAALFVVLAITTCPENIVDIFWSQSQSKNTSQNLKTRPRFQKCFGFWDVFWILGSVFEFWDMFSYGFWEVFWILASIFEFKKVLWILWCVLDLGTCFVPRPVTVNLSNFRKKKKKKTAHRPRRPKRRILGEQKYLNFPKWVWIIYGLVQETNKTSIDFFYSLARWCNKALKLQGKNFNLFVFFAVWCFPKLIPAKRWDLLNRPQVNRLDVTWCIRFFV